MNGTAAYYAELARKNLEERDKRIEINKAAAERASTVPFLRAKDKLQW